MIPSRSDPSLPALQRGDPDAWRALFETYADPLYLYLYHRCDRDAAAAEDVRQETFLAAIECIGAFRGEAPLFGWLCGIARNKAYDMARKRRREMPLDTLNPETMNEMGEDEGESFHQAEAMDDSAMPEIEVVTGETRALVVEALWSLPVEYRQALIWRYERGASVAQIADRLRRSYKAVESLLSRARAGLKEIMLKASEPG